MNPIRLIIFVLTLIACSPSPETFPDRVAANEAGVSDAADAVDAAPRLTFPALRVFVAPEWTAEQRRQVWSGIGLLRPVLPSVIEVATVDDADLGVYAAHSQDCAVVAAGTYFRTAYADPACFPTARGFDLAHAIGHLVLDHLGLKHLCDGPGGVDCSPLPYGRGLTNAHFAEAFTPATATTTWTEAMSELDVLEGRRVLATQPWRFR